MLLLPRDRQSAPDVADGADLMVHLSGRQNGMVNFVFGRCATKASAPFQGSKRARGHARHPKSSAGGEAITSERLYSRCAKAAGKATKH